MLGWIIAYIKEIVKIINVDIKMIDSLFLIKDIPRTRVISFADWLERLLLILFISKIEASFYIIFCKITLGGIIALNSIN